MLFSSTTFLFLFLPVVLFIYYIILRKIKYRNYWLLFVSLCFYAWGEPVYVLLMLASILGNYLLGLWMDCGSEHKQRSLILVISVAFNLGILFYFKYYGFFVKNLNNILGLQLTERYHALPIGISFFTFQGMSYVIDLYRKTTPVQKNPCYLALYISFFPQLIAGPIVRYNTIEQQIGSRTVTLEIFEEGVCRFLQGFAKKVLLSNVLSITAERIFELAAQQNLSVAAAWLGALAYTFQIYFDFSGYSDMAIGLGKMFGFQFEENFRHPYISRSVSEFWNRWHISLGQWFRDYVYFPLGGSRVSKIKLVRNLSVVWLLTGIWHGAAWQFIVWGVLYGIIITLEKLTGFPKKAENPIIIRTYSFATFLVVMMGWVLFGAVDLKSALYQIGSMFGIGAKGLWDTLSAFIIREYGLYLLAGAFFSTPVPGLFIGKLKKNAIYDVAKACVYMIMLLVAVSFLLMNAHNPFIYFNF